MFNVYKIPEFFFFTDFLLRNGHSLNRSFSLTRLFFIDSKDDNDDVMYIILNNYSLKTTNFNSNNDII